MKDPIHLIKYKLRKPLWYLSKPVLLHRWYLGAWPDPYETHHNVITKYGYPHSMLMVDEINFVSPALASFMYDLPIDGRGQIND